MRQMRENMTEMPVGFAFRCMGGRYMVSIVVMRKNVVAKQDCLGQHQQEYGRVLFQHLEQSYKVSSNSALINRRLC